MIIKVELSDTDLGIICRVLSDAADYARDIGNCTDEDDEELEDYLSDESNCRRIAGYLDTVGLIAVMRDFHNRRDPSVN